jgi:tetratricopeptide (TPR) repeat protein
VEADLALARGRILHARFLDERTEDPAELSLFERAVELYQELGDAQGEAESLFWVGCFHQVVRSDDDTAVPSFERSCELATLAGDKLTTSYAVRHLAIAEHRAGQLDAARERLEESVRLRRELGFLSGVAANQVGLAYIAAAQNRRDDALALLDEAGINAKAGAADAILREVEEARSNI